MIDLHMNTNHSDGTDSVEELLKKAEKKNLEIISITDHDSVGAYFELEENPELMKLYSGKLIIGTELMTYYRGVSIEILGYGIDYKKLRMQEIDIEKMQQTILSNMKNVAKNLGLKFDERNTYVDQSDVSRQYASCVMAAELLKYDENKEILNRIGDKFTIPTFFRIHQSDKKSPFYFDTSNLLLDINEIISRIHEAGGLAFLAHGYIYPFKNKDEIIEEILSTTNIDGMECIYTEFLEEERKKAYNLCKKYNKFMSGGTDYHAKNKPDIELGTGRNNNIKIEKDFIKDWVHRVAIWK